MIFLDSPFTEAIDTILLKTKPERVLLVTGGGSFERSPMREYFDSLAQQINVIHYPGLGSNPEYERVEQALSDLADTGDIDLIIAAGGGSVIDYAKLIALYLPNQELFTENFDNLGDAEPTAPILAIPTTAGSGSEATHFAVLYKGDQKYSIASKKMKPTHVVVDPSLTHSMPPYLTACSGMDALCQAIESLWARSATDESRRYATKALELIVPAIVKAVHNPDPDSRRAMSLGAYHAGQAINISKTTGPHAFSYHLTRRYGVPHGEAVAMTMEAFITLNYSHLTIEVKQALGRVFQTRAHRDLADAFRSLRSSIGLLRTTFPSVGVITEKQMKGFLNSVNTERLKNNPVLPPVQALLHELNAKANELGKVINDCCD